MSAEWCTVSCVQIIFVTVCVSVSVFVSLTSHSPSLSFFLSLSVFLSLSSLSLSFHFLSISRPPEYSTMDNSRHPKFRFLREYSSIFHFRGLAHAHAHVYALEDVGVSAA